MLLLHLPLIGALTLGCVLGSISPAVALPMAKGFGAAQEAQDILVIETSLTDVFSIILVFSLMRWNSGGGIDIGEMIGSILSSLVFAAFIGFTGSFAWLKLIGFVRRFPNTTLSTLAFLFLLYGFSEVLGFSGAIAALAFGFGIANKPFGALERLGSRMQVPKASLSDSEKGFFGEVIFILRTFFFLYLGISMRFSGIAGMLFAVGFVMMIAALRAFLGLRLSNPELASRDSRFIALMSPKGLATAVLAGLPVQAEMAGAAAMQEIAYDVVFFSIVLSALLAFLLKKGLLDALFERKRPSQS